MIGTDRISRYFTLILICIISVSVIVGVFKYYVWKDFQVSMTVSCDPGEESCFAAVCDESIDECTDGEVTYYKYVYMEASLVPKCDEWAGECPELVCNNDASCQEFSCSEASRTLLGVEDECSEFEPQELVVEEWGEEISEEDIDAAFVSTDISTSTE